MSFFPIFWKRLPVYEVIPCIPGKEKLLVQKDKSDGKRCKTHAGVLTTKLKELQRSKKVSLQLQSHLERHGYGWGL